MRIPRRDPAYGGVFGRRRQLAYLFAAILLAGSSCRSAPEQGKNDVVSGASLAGGGSPAVVGELSPVDDGPRALVVFFSQGHATKRVAEDIATLLGADLERIVEKRARRWGFFGFMAAGAASTFGQAPPIEPPLRDPAEYAAVVVCTPIWAWHMAPPTRSWLRLNRGRLPELSAFVTVSGDTDPAKIVAAMAEESGRQPVVFTGFSDRDFEAENRTTYVARIGSIVELFRHQRER